MNKIYRLVWNRALGVVQVATEFAKAPRGGQGSTNVGGSPRRSRLAQACATALLIGLGTAALPVWAVAPPTYTVTSATDSGNTSATGTLSWAIDQANTHPGSTIDFGSITTVTETGTLPQLTVPTTLTSTGDVTIDGAMTGSFAWAWTGTGTLTLAGDGTSFNGTGYVYGGTLQVGSGSAHVQITGNNTLFGPPAGVAMQGNPATTNTSGLNVAAGGVVQGGNGLDGHYSSGYNGSVGVGVYGGIATIDNAGTIAGGSGGVGYEGHSADANGGDAYGGHGYSGGSGGAGVYGTGLILTNSGTIAAGAGGAGGAGGNARYGYYNNGGYGGAGGDGGAGISQTGNPSYAGNFTLDNSGTLNAGAGGIGGNGGSASDSPSGAKYGGSHGGDGGYGGDGGAGVQGYSFTATNSGAINAGAGGDGGAGGRVDAATYGYNNGGNGGDAGQGGDAVSGRSFSLDNSGSLSGGAGGNGGVGGSVSNSYSSGQAHNNAGEGGFGGAGAYGVYGYSFTLTNSGTISGGAGGIGASGGGVSYSSAYWGNDGGNGGNGGDGGDGGAGVLGASFTLTNSGAISAGVGGVGGQGGSLDHIGYSYGSYAGDGGNGGDGGAGIYSWGGEGGSGYGLTLTNSGTISAGAGGIGGTGGDVSNAASYYRNTAGNGGYGGDGGVGAYGGYFTLTNSGTINAGAGGVGGNGGSVSYGYTYASDGPGYNAGGVGGDGGNGGGGVSGRHATVTNSGTINAGAGGDGGAGGDVSNSYAAYYGNYAGDGGRGGAGGDGVSGRGGPSSFTVTNSGTITGGNGGNGGAGGNVTNSTGGYAAYGGNGGNGGGGGAGVIGYSVNLTNTGTITGGNGGDGGVGGTAAGGYAGVQGARGYGGAGVVAYGDNAMVIHGGTIAGGHAGAGAAYGYGPGPGPIPSAVGNPQADAISFYGSNNTLELWGGYNFVGNVVNYSGGNNTLILGGDVDGSFDLSQIVMAMPTTYSGSPVYYGFNTFAKTGTSTWALNGTNPDTEAWSVTGGKLEVGDAAHPDTVLNGSVTVNGGAVGGHGTITGDVSVTSGMTQPGGSVGMLTVGGDYVQDAASTLMIELTSDPTPGTGSSQLMVNGTASLAGTLGLIMGPGNYTHAYNVVHADGGVSGTFSTVALPTLLQPYLTSTVTYHPNDVLVNFNVTDKAYVGMPNYPATVALGAERTFSTVLGRLGPTAQGRQGVWGQVMAGRGGLGGGSRYQFSGTAAGYGHAITNNFVLGVAVSGATTTTTLTPMQVRAKPIGGFVYGIWKNGGWRVSGSLGSGWLSQGSQRHLMNLAAVEHSFSHGHYAGAALRLDYTAKLGGWNLSPYAGLDTLNSRYGAVTEQGMGLLALTYGKVSQHLTHYQAGLRLSTDFGAWHPWVKAGTEGWQGDRAIEVTETFLGFPRQVTSTSLPGNALNGGAGVTWRQGGWGATLSYNGSWGSNFHGNDASIQVRYSW